MKALFLLIALCLPLVAGADLYRYRDAAGNVVYTDRPVPGAERVPPGTITVIPAPKDRPVDVEVEIDMGGSKQQPAPGQERDFAVTVVRPGEDEAVRANDGRVTIEVKVDPAPEPGQRLRFRALLDGEPAGPVSQEPRWTIDEVSRGTHRLEVALLDEQGRELARSRPVTFHVLRVSRLIRPH